MPSNLSTCTFQEKCEVQWAEGHFVCVGLDPRIGKVPKFILAEAAKSLGVPFHDDASSLLADSDVRRQVFAAALEIFSKRIVEATCETAAAYKPNIAFWECHGAPGLEALLNVVRHIREVAPEVLVIVDAKRADIGSTNEAYINALLSKIGLAADAVTLHPYLGKQALQPFLSLKEKGNIILCRTSNDGAGEFQDLMTLTREELMDGPDIEGLNAKVKAQRLEAWIQNVRAAAMPLYQRVARHVAEDWNEHGNCGLVTGATSPAEMAAVRKVAPSLFLLIPGIGAQGGDLSASVAAAMDARSWGFVINSSRGIIHRSSEEDFAEAAAAETARLTREINKIRFEHMLLTGERGSLADALMKVGAVKFGAFRLKLHEHSPDAPESPYYFNLRIPENNGPLTDGLVEEIAEALFALVIRKGCQFNGVAGLPKAGDPFAKVYAAKAMTPRLQLVKEIDGDRRWIDRIENTGQIMIGGTVLVVDDLVTGEGTKLEGVKVLQSEGMRVKDIAVLIDRRPPGRESQLAAEGVTLHAVYTQAELLNHYLATGAITAEQHARSHRYQAELDAFLAAEN